MRKQILHAPRQPKRVERVGKERVGRGGGGSYNNPGLPPDTLTLFVKGAETTRPMKKKTGTSGRLHQSAPFPSPNHRTARTDPSKTSRVRGPTCFQTSGMPLEFPGKPLKGSADRHTRRDPSKPPGIRVPACSHIFLEAPRTDMVSKIPGKFLAHPPKGSADRHAFRDRWKPRGPRIDSRVRSPSARTTRRSLALPNPVHRRRERGFDLRG